MDKTNKTSNVHDKFFRKAMADARVAYDFFNTHLSSEVLNSIDLNYLKLQSRSSVNEFLEESIVDVLYKTKLKDKFDQREVFLYLLLEHQSSPDKLMPFRILKYTCNVMDEHLKITRGTLLPLVYPIVLYHGVRSYPYSSDIKDLVDAPQKLIDQYFLKPFQLIDLGKIEDEKLKQRKWCGVMEFALKHIFVREVSFIIKELVNNLNDLDQSDGTDYILHILQYIFQRGKSENKKEFLNIINNEISYEVGDKIMNFWEQSIQESRNEGKIEGKMEGKLEMAKKMLANGLGIHLIANCSGLSIQKLQELSKQSQVEIVQ